MPRQAKRPTAPEIRDRNTRDLLGRPGLAGLARIGGIGARGGGGRSVLTDVAPDESESTGAAQLLVLSLTAGEIAPGGAAVPFDTIVAQHGFEGVAQPSGGYWVHPVTGVYTLTYEHRWDTYEGGGTIQVQLDDTSVPEGLIASALRGQEGTKTIQYYAEAGATGRIFIAHSSTEAELCDAVVWVAITDPTEAAPVSDEGPPPVETFWFDSKVTSATSTMLLENGVIYRIVVTGNCREANTAYSFGSPDTILFPSPGESAEQAGLDAEVGYASPVDTTLPFHNGVGFVMDTGLGFSHREPIGGAVSVPSPDHSYEYEVAGTGAVLQVKWQDSAYGDNNGMFRVDIYETA